MIDIMTGFWMASVAWLVAMGFMYHIIYSFEHDKPTAPLSLVYAIVISIVAGIFFLAGLCVAIFEKPLF